MNRHRPGKILISLAAAILLLTACGGEKSVSHDPPTVKYGEDISEMGMFVTDPRFTVAALIDDEWVLFDDIGEMLRYRDIHPETEIQVLWTHDYHSQEWLKAEDAWYAQSQGFTTPMGWLVGSFADEDAARAFVEEHGGVVMTWDEADARTWTSPPAPDDPLLQDAASPHTHPATPAG